MKSTLRRFRSNYEEKIAGTHTPLFPELSASEDRGHKTVGDFHRVTREQLVNGQIWMWIG